jgi:hypothetical protein
MVGRLSDFEVVELQMDFVEEPYDTCETVECVLKK